MILGFVLIGMLTAAGIGLLKNRSWGRSLSVLYAVITIVLTIISTVLTYIYLVQPLMEKAAEMAPGPEKYHCKSAQLVDWAADALV